MNGFSLGNKKPGAMAGLINWECSLGMGIIALRGNVYRSALTSVHADAPYGIPGC
jgi:hypothetical protein